MLDSESNNCSANEFCVYTLANRFDKPGPELPMVDRCLLPAGPEAELSTMTPRPATARRKQHRHKPYTVRFLDMDDGTHNDHNDPLVDAVRTIPNRRDYNASERSKLWYSERDYRRIIDEVRVVHAKASPPDQRGLENLNGSVYANVKVAVSAVLNEQERQRLDGRDEPVLMSVVYIQATRRCRTEARNMAIRDEEIVNKQYRNDSNDSNDDLESSIRNRTRYGIRRKLSNWLASKRNSR